MAIKGTDVIERVRRSTLNMTNVNTAHKSKGGFRQNRIVENDFATTLYDQMKLRFTAS